MKALFKRLQLQFDGAVQVRHDIDNFYGDNEPTRIIFTAYVANYEPFLTEQGIPTHNLRRDNLQLLKTDVKEQIRDWCRKQAEEGGITDVEFEPTNVEPFNVEEL